MTHHLTLSFRLLRCSQPCRKTAFTPPLLPLRALGVARCAQQTPSLSSHGDSSDRARTVTLWRALCSSLRAPQTHFFQGISTAAKRLASLEGAAARRRRQPIRTRLQSTVTLGRARCGLRTAPRLPDAPLPRTGISLHLGLPRRVPAPLTSFGYRMSDAECTRYVVALRILFAPIPAAGALACPMLIVSRTKCHPFASGHWGVPGWRYRRPRRGCRRWRAQFWSPACDSPLAWYSH